MDVPAPASNRSFYVLNFVISLSAVALLAYILVIRPRTTGTMTTLDLSFLPAVNASFNTLSALLLIAGYAAIVRGARQLHQRLMLSALGSSTLFLLSYLTYHYVHGDTKFQGQGTVRWVYFFILISHVVLSIVVFPMVLSSAWFGLSGKFSLHRAVAKWTLPLWLYVSVTGVVVFFMLR